MESLARPAEAQVERNTSLILSPLLKSQVGTILIKGEPGTGKTTLAMELLSIYGKGIYVSTRASQEQAIEHHPVLSRLSAEGKILEVRDSNKPPDKYFSFDDQRFADPRSVLNAVIDSASKISQPLIVLDSWDAIANKIERTERLKVEQSLELISSGNKAKLIFLSEQPELTTVDYLVDAVLTLKNDLHDNHRIRKLEWNKFRGSEIPHWVTYYTLAGGRFKPFLRERDQEIRGLKPKTFKPIPHSERYYSTGSEDLDSIFGGGIPKGSTVLVEFGKYFGSVSFNLLSTMIRCNFLMNGGCNITIPSPGVSSFRIKGAVSNYVPKSIIDEGVRVSRFDADDQDPSFFKLDNSSSSKAMYEFLSEAQKLKGSTNRPCLWTIGVESLEYSYSEEEAFRFCQSVVQKVRRLNDACYIVAKYGSNLVRALSDIVDIHLKFESLDGTAMASSFKPWSQLYQISYDYSQGYPLPVLLPIV
ncbi:MAG: hypothetical protein JRN20_03275 [Nitrososphaerota archaeon]|nr:hypothetical protein [Nitrososphaerota archaeon]